MVGISCGWAFTVSWAADGSAFAWGSNSAGQCAQPADSDCPGPSEIAFPTRMPLSPQEGATSSTSPPRRSPLREGMPSAQPAPAPNIESGDRRVLLVACGYDHALALTADGTVHRSVLACAPRLLRALWCIHHASSAPHARAKPPHECLQHTAPASYASLSLNCRLSHCRQHQPICLCHSWGAGGRGQLGIGSFPQRQPMPARVCSMPEAIMSGIDPVVHVACGFFHSVAVTMSGCVVAWGDNT